MTYNIRHGLATDRTQSIERIRDFIASQSVEIVALQEVDRRLARSRWVDQARWLGEQLGMESLFGCTLHMVVGQFGNAILSRYPIESHEFHPLPSTDEPRGILKARIATPHGPCTFLSTHFGLDAEERLMQAGATLEVLRRAGAPAVMMGDLNARPESRTVKLLTEPRMGLTSLCPLDILTFPAESPNTRIDYVLATAGVRVESVEVPHTLASDHLPIIVELYL